MKTLLDGVKVGTLLYVPGNLTKGTCLNMVRGCCANDVQFNAICSLCSGEGGGYLGRIASLVSEVTSVKKAKLFLKIQVAKIHFSLAVAPAILFLNGLVIMIMGFSGIGLAKRVWHPHFNTIHCMP